MKRILVTGGAGFIGSNLVRALHSKGYDITVLDNLSEQVHSADPENSALYQSIVGKAHFIRGSIACKDDVNTALSGQDIVVHFAAETGTGQSMYEVDHYVSANIGATAQMLDMLGNGDYGVKRMIVASSRSIYGEGRYKREDGSYIYPPHRAGEDMQNGIFDVLDPKDNSPLTLVSTNEDSIIHPSSVYGITKQVQEQLTMTVCPLLSIEPVALRYQNVYGPGQSLTNPYTGILSIFSNLIMSGKGINIFEDGRESRDFVYIDDVVEATMLAIEHKNAPGQVFNVGSGVATNVQTVADKLIEYLGITVPVRVSGNFRAGDIRHNYACLERISAQLGFAPKVSFDEGIAKFTRWARKLGPGESRYEESIDEMRERGLLK